MRHCSRLFPSVPEWPGNSEKRRRKKHCSRLFPTVPNSPMFLARTSPLFLLEREGSGHSFGKSAFARGKREKWCLQKTTVPELPEQCFADHRSRQCAEIGNSASSTAKLTTVPKRTDAIGNSAYTDVGGPSAHKSSRGSWRQQQGDRHEH